MGGSGIRSPSGGWGEWDIAGGVTGIRQVTGAIPCLPSSGVGGREWPPGGLMGGENAVRGNASDMPVHGAEEVDGVALACARHGEMQAP